MSRTRNDDFDDDDPLDSTGVDDASDSSDPEAPDAADVGGDDEDLDDNTIPCPHCKRPVYEGAEWCPHCRSYLSSEDAPREHAWWVWLGVILCLLAVVVWIFM